MRDTIFKPGTIITATYGRMDNTKQVGVFFVIQDEAFDASISHNSNITVLKCTTSNAVLDNYLVPLNHYGDDSFLTRPTFVACSKIQTLAKSQVIKPVGNVCQQSYIKVVKLYSKFSTEVQNQLMNQI